MPRAKRFYAPVLDVAGLTKTSDMSNPEEKQNNGAQEKRKKKASAKEMARIFGPSVVQATGNIIGGYFSGKGAGGCRVIGISTVPTQKADIYGGKYVRGRSG